VQRNSTLTGFFMSLFRGRALPAARWASAGWRTRTWAAPGTRAAVFGEIPDQRVHVGEVRRINNEPAFLPVLDEASVCQIREMKGQRRGGNFQCFADHACSQSVRAGFHKEPEDRQPRLMGEGGERVYSLHRFHISRILETIYVSQVTMKPRQASVIAALGTAQTLAWASS
jgi:hypothetical protein